MNVVALNPKAPCLERGGHVYMDVFEPERGFVCLLCGQPSNAVDDYRSEFVWACQECGTLVSYTVAMMSDPEQELRLRLCCYMARGMSEEDAKQQVWYGRPNPLHEKTLT